MTPPVDELLFTAASTFTDARERAAFLDYVCRDDPRLRKQLEELLEIEAQADTLFEFQPEVLPRAKPSPASGEEGVGATIGKYRLITRIGSGGCGVVYYAQQEEPVRRKVALKIVKLGMDTEAVIARFELERQALAQMDHPNIARVLDAGATASGRPYFVMELVEGQRITDFCDENRLPLRARLELFLQVCRAIQHAHQKGVIHRDIKPSNVLVRWHDGVAVPKVIDFGIAKVTAPHISGSDLTATRLNQFMGTPDYMSPEQARGSSDVDTRSDLYSLGVLLHELLCGRTPFAFKQLPQNAFEELHRVILEQEPKPPSLALTAATPQEAASIASDRGTTLAHLRSQLTGDLDWIVIKALDKERTRRYESATGLAMDVQRFLSNEPVLARPPSRAYRLGKLARRNKLVFAAGSIATFGLLAGFGTSTRMYFREKAALEEETRLRAKAELREDIAHAAVKIKYGDLPGADKLLARVPINQTPSSLEAAQAFDAVANWHIHASRLSEASARYQSMIRAIASVDSSDLPEVSFNLLPAAASVAYAGGAQSYEELRQMAIQRFGSTTNSVVAERSLKACILLPADEKSLKALEGLAKMVERDIEQKQGTMGNDAHYTAWGCFALSLWNYRIGNLPKAAQWSARSLAFPNDNEARIASLQILNAMIERKLGHSNQAKVSLDQGRKTIQKVFAQGEWLKLRPPSYWFEWLNAALLLREADRS
jgi:serine/threonine protein kinase